MAQSRASSPLFLTTLLLLSIAIPLAHASFIGTPNVQTLNVSGNLCCTSTGNCPGTPVTGATVSLTCLNILTVTSVLGQNTTDVNGSFTITAPAPSGVILGLSKIPCVVNVQLPLNATICPVLSTAAGVLVGLVQGVGTVTTQANGLVLNAMVSTFFQL